MVGPHHALAGFPPQGQFYTSRSGQPSLPHCHSSTAPFPKFSSWMTVGSRVVHFLLLTKEQLIISQFGDHRSFYSGRDSGDYCSVLHWSFSFLGLSTHVFLSPRNQAPLSPGWWPGCCGTCPDRLQAAGRSQGDVWASTINTPAKSLPLNPVQKYILIFSSSFTFSSVTQVHSLKCTIVGKFMREYIGLCPTSVPLWLHAFYSYKLSYISTYIIETLPITVFVQISHCLHCSSM